jgi:HNH/ENDO VII superfamily nuclease with conserved GHE residues
MAYGSQRRSRIPELAERYKDGKVSWKDLLDEYNDAKHYQPEDPITNMSHAFEAH